MRLVDIRKPVVSYLRASLVDGGRTWRVDGVQYDLITRTVDIITRLA